MSYKVDNAVILAAGFSSRFAPLSYEKPKALVCVKGEVLIERQIRQLREAGVRDIVVVVGYKKEQFEYLRHKWEVTIVENSEYETRNNHSSIRAARKYLKNSYICSSDNYFTVNPFEKEVDEAYYATVYAAGRTKEWCVTTDSDGWITDVTIGGRDCLYMLGHVFWSEEFSRDFLEILDAVYEKPETADMLWETIFCCNLNRLRLKARQYSKEQIREFDTLDDLRAFDDTYIADTGSCFIRRVAEQLRCGQNNVIGCRPWTHEGATIGFLFEACGRIYGCRYSDGIAVVLDTQNEVKEPQEHHPNI